MDAPRTVLLDQRGVAACMTVVRMAVRGRGIIGVETQTVMFIDPLAKDVEDVVQCLIVLVVSYAVQRIVSPIVTVTTSPFP